MKGGKVKAESNPSDAALKRKGADSQLAGKKAAENATKDLTKPKRPTSPFFVFMEEFRVQYQQKHPNNKSIAAIGHAGGEKWKSLSDAEKAPYIAKSENRKEEYKKNMRAYKKRSAEGANAADEDESDKSKSEVKLIKKKMKSEVKVEEEDDDAESGED